MSPTLVLVLLGAATALVGVLFVASLLLLPAAAMIFDAPGARAKPGNWLGFVALGGAPVTCLAAIVAGWTSHAASPGLTPALWWMLGLPAGHALLLARVWRLI